MDNKGNDGMWSIMLYRWILSFVSHFNKEAEVNEFTN